jgi:hypothetical protein
VGFFRECFSALGTLHDGAPPPSPATPPGGGDGRLESGFSQHDQDPHVCYIHRWRLELADPACLASCKPKKPIVYHIDPSVPERWAGCVARGVENWNRAFNEAGWSGAMVARREGDAEWPADYAAADMRYSSITWAPSLEQTYAVGPSNVDPRTGEILNADIMFAESWVRHFLGDWQGIAPEGGVGPGGVTARAPEAAAMVTATATATTTATATATVATPSTGACTGGAVRARNAFTTTEMKAEVQARPVRSARRWPQGPSGRPPARSTAPRSTSARL